MHRLKFLPISIILIITLFVAGPSFNVAARPAAAPTQVDLGAAQSFAVLAGAGITNTGTTTISGDVGTFPTTTETGFGSVTLIGSSVNHAGDATTQLAKTALTNAYNFAELEGPKTMVTASSTDSFGVGTINNGNPLTAGVYNSASSMGLTGTLILDGQNNPDAVFVFQAGSTLTTASNSNVVLIRGAQACNVYWQVGSSATLGTSTAFQGTILALTSITMNTNATLIGQALAQNGAVTLDTNTITRPLCSPSVTTTLSANPVTADPATTVSDSAVLIGDSSNSGGTVTYSVYTDSACTVMSQTTGPLLITTPGVMPDSPPLPFTTAGTYYWQAAYSGDDNNLSAKSACISEALLVNAVANVTPTLTTNLSATSVAVGSSVNDTATLTGAAASAGGTVTYTYYTDSICTLNAVDAGTKTVTGVGNIVPNSNSMPFNLAGTYYWQAVYSGGTGTNGAVSTCNVAAETLTVGKLSPTISTTLSATSVSAGSSVHDSATLNGVTNDAIGTVTYSVYTNSACTLNAQTGGIKTVTSGIVLDSNSILFNSAGTYYWQAVYTGDINNNGATSLCDEVLTVTPTSVPAVDFSAAGLPNSGFAPSQITVLSVQSAEKDYSNLGDLWLEIPRLSVQIPIVGVPQQPNGEWDISWLGNQAGWLNGSAFPTWSGNSVLTAHVYDASGNPGPFVALYGLSWGDKIIIHIMGEQHVYEVRQVTQVKPDATKSVFKHKELPYITLITCRGYDEASNSYKYRVIVRAVLVEVK